MWTIHPLLFGNHQPNGNNNAGTKITSYLTNDNNTHTHTQRTAGKIKNRKLSDEKLESASFGCLKRFAFNYSVAHAQANGSAAAIVSFDRYQRHLLLSVAHNCIAVSSNWAIHLYIYFSFSLSCSLLSMDWRTFAGCLPLPFAAHFIAFDFVNLLRCASALRRNGKVWKIEIDLSSWK